MSPTAWLALYVAYGLIWFWLSTLDDSDLRIWKKTGVMLSKERTSIKVVVWIILAIVISLFILAWPIMLPGSRLISILYKEKVAAIRKKAESDEL